MFTQITCAATGAVFQELLIVHLQLVRHSEVTKGEEMYSH